MICDKCGKEFSTGNTNGMPNGVEFVLKDRTRIAMCQQCLIDFGKMKDEEKSAVLEELKNKNRNS